MNRELSKQFFNAWETGEERFIINSSGSSGEPRPFTLERKWMVWSASRTNQFVKANSNDTIYCCLPLNKVGGLMMLVRSKVWGIPIIIKEATLNPLLEPIKANIISITPLQLYHILSNKTSYKALSNFREILIGGAELPYPLEMKLKHLDDSIKVRHSYGMTETYSHIATRRINGNEASEWFTPFEDVVMKCENNGVATIITPFYPNGLKTNDIIKMNRDKKFKILGRNDFTINSGGIKLHPEEIEKSIHETLSPNSNFIISSLRDVQLGMKLVLVCQNRNEFDAYHFDFLKALNLYAIPKEIIEISEFPINEGGKIDRLKILNLINK